MIGTWILTGLCVLIWGALAFAGFGIASEPQYGALHAPFYFHLPLVALTASVAAAALALWVRRGDRRQVIGHVGRASLGLLILLVLPYGCFYSGGI